jgi:hypothetical protein
VGERRKSEPMETHKRRQLIAALSVVIIVAALVSLNFPLRRIFYVRNESIF